LGNDKVLGRGRALGIYGSCSEGLHDDHERHDPRTVRRQGWWAASGMTFPLGMTGRPVFDTAYAKEADDSSLSA
jgi:hypothetical protein